MDYYLKKQKRSGIILFVLSIILLISVSISLAIGRYIVSLADIIKAFVGGMVSPEVSQVLFSVRLPRVLGAVIIGGSLSLSGAAYQGMFKNPLVSPDILGSSAGAGFGAALGILLSFQVYGIKMSSFIFGLGAVLLTWLISTKFGKGDNSLFLLILGGIIISNLFQSLISLIKYTADPTDKLPAITFWLMGSLSKVNMKDIQLIIIPFIICVLLLIYSAPKLNILALGEEEAKTLGIDVEKLQVVIIVVATILTVISVSMCGMIGWVGLVVPHLARMIVGTDFKVLIPASLLLGSSYLLLIDDICRSLLAVEIPLGIVTSLAGLPFFLYLLTKKDKGW